MSAFDRMYYILAVSVRGPYTISQFLIHKLKQMNHKSLYELNYNKM